METLILIEKYFLLFMIYSVGGWIIEEIVCSISEKKIVDRGFLIGPICPVYGFGGLAMTLFLSKFRANPITLFCMAVIISSVLEYFTSYIMEKIFHARWWDYSNDKLNLNGRICIKNVIPFGLFGILVIYIINPFVFRMLDKMPLTALNIVSYSLAIIMVFDIVVSMIVVAKVTVATRILESEHPKDNTDEITARVKKELRSTVAGNRLVEAYPNFTTITTKIKQIAEKTAQKSKQAVKNTAQRGKEAVNTGKKKVEDKLKGKK